MAKKERPEVLHGRTKRIKTGCGNMYVTVNFEGDKPVEVFCRLGKAGGCAAAQTEVIGRLATAYLADGGDTEDLVNQLLGVRCNMPIGLGPSAVFSCADGIAKVLKELFGGNKE